MQITDKWADSRLVDAYANGNNEAFDMLLDRYKAQIFSYIFRIVRNKDLADDFFQETFVKAIIKIREGRYADSGKFSAWLMRIAHNLIIDYYRQEKPENTASTDDADINLLNRMDLSEGTVEDLMVEKQTRDDVRRIIKRLPREQREVLVMRYYRDMSFKDIAKTTGVSINTSLGRMRYALINLRKMAGNRREPVTA